MKNVPPAIEAKYVDCSPEELKDHLGRFHEELVRTKERMKKDPKVLEMERELKNYKAANYLGSIKRLEIHLAAVRRMALMKGVSYDEKEK